MAAAARSRKLLLVTAVLLCTSVVLAGCSKAKELPQDVKQQDSALRKQKAGD